MVASVYISKDTHRERQNENSRKNHQVDDSCMYSGVSSDMVGRDAEKLYPHRKVPGRDGEYGAL
jgi:hypothetical protein